MQSLQRTVRRCTALLLVPVALLVYALTRYLESPYGAASNLDILVVSQWISAALFLGAAGYLVVSPLATLTGSMEETPESVRDEQSDA